jgi:hypothetical protein
MDSFPFTNEEWLQVKESALTVLNASLAEDDVLRSSHEEELHCVLSQLKVKYGNHPVLLETEADYCDDPATQRDLYQQAIRQAESGQLATYTIRISLASVLLQDFNQPDQALAELLACQAELEPYADDSERREWTELVEECKRVK